MLKLEIISKKDPRLVKNMEIHYSQPKGFVGRSICYAVLYNGIYYGTIVGGSATLHLPGRNDYFNIDKTKLNNIINNIFFHVEKQGGKYPCRWFTTKVIREFRYQIYRDWRHKYGDKVIGFETLVELPRTGDCYKKDDWDLIGQTVGYTCKRIGGKGFEKWGGKRIWDTKNLRPKLVFARKVDTDMENFKKSTMKCEVVPVTLEKHPNADLLSVVKIFDGYTYVANTESWKDRKLGVFIPPDSLCDVSRPEFADLVKDAKYNEDSTTNKMGKYARIKAKKIRGIQSYGYMIPAPEDAKPGDDLAERFGIKHYEPELLSVDQKGGVKGLFSGGDIALAPAVDICYYDVDAFLRYYKQVFEENEVVLSMEKLHGQNAAYVYWDGQYHCKSRENWKKEFSSPPKITLEDLIAKMGDEERAKQAYQKAVVEFTPKTNCWWQVLRQSEKLQKFLRDNPGYIVFGENYGNNPGFRHDCEPGKQRFRAFDIRYEGKFLDIKKAMDLGKDLDWCPVLDESPLNFDKLTELATGNTTLGQEGIKEGIVVRGLVEKWNYHCGRNLLKLKNPVFLEKH